MRTNELLTDFLIENYQQAREWNRKNALDWVTWHRKNGFVIVALNDDDSICGMLLCRPVMKPQDAADWYATDPEGSCIFVDVVISLREGVLPVLVSGAIERFGMRDFVAWKRPPYYVIEFHDAHKFRRIVFRKGLVYGTRR